MNGRIIAAVLAVVVLVAGCGHDAKRDLVRDAGSSFSHVERGSLHLQLALGSADEPAKQVGFGVSGSFDLGEPGATFPAVDITTTNLGAPQEQPTHFVSTGRDAFIVRDDVGYQLSAADIEPLRLQSTGSNGNGSFPRDLAGWMIDPSPRPSTTTPSGEPVDHVTARADPVHVVNDVVQVAARLGGGPDDALQISSTEADRVRGAVQSSSLDVLTGRTDHLLRAVTARVDFVARDPATSGGGALLQALHKLGRLTLTVEVRVDRPNSTVAIAAPADIRPLTELRKG